MALQSGAAVSVLWSPVCAVTCVRCREERDRTIIESTQRKITLLFKVSLAQGVRVMCTGLMTRLHGRWDSLRDVYIYIYIYIYIKY